MRSKRQRWFDALGYTKDQKGLYYYGDKTPALYAYRNEINELLNPKGKIKATAVLDVEGIPTVCFLDNDGQIADDPSALNLIREKIWNQNLISIVILVSDNEIRPIPVSKREFDSKVIPGRKLRSTGEYSLHDIQSGEVFRRHTEWFSSEHRVDQDLLRSLEIIVRDFSQLGIEKSNAQYLMAQVLFISYLEHREIVGETYRTKHSLSRFEDLIRNSDCKGVLKLLTQLKCDFNGDFLESESSNGTTLWKRMPEKAFKRINDFLARTNLETGQKSLWNYDFRYIPVELISGIYESFLSDEKKDVGAYYTPRNLANLAVDQAFSGSSDILSERIYDGACGSGILLTTAYRRMISYIEARDNKPLSFTDRRTLLEGHIFGSDQNVSACRVTAFSLYLSMLERLKPTDIAKLQEDQNVKLPSLNKTNILGGSELGDFFSKNNPHATGNKFTLFISNPPWVEPKGKEILSSDLWAKENDIKIPRRQTAGAFMQHARDCLEVNGRFCLILPISIFAAPTSKTFLKKWLRCYKIDTLINFGDLRKLLFSTAQQPCVIAAGETRKEQVNEIPNVETFEYWVPKADISFAFGRLTLHSSDRHKIHTKMVSHDNEVFTSLYWGTARDVSTIAQLRLSGQLDELIGEQGWSARKGFHRKDSSIVDPVSSEPLRKMSFLDAKNFKVTGPIFNNELLSKFPSDIDTVARLPDSLLSIFNSPKILFTDGITSHRTVRAAFSNKEFSFSSSIGVIAGSKQDEELLRFVAVYLHSSLAQYVLLLSAYQISFERERVTLSDIKKLPFIHPSKHPNPSRAWEIIKEVVTKTVAEEDIKTLLKLPLKIDNYEPLIFEYFGLNDFQKLRVQEVAQEISENMQPSSILTLNTSLQQRPNTSKLYKYMKALHWEMTMWIKARGGVGDVVIDVVVNSSETCGPLGIVSIKPSPKDTALNNSISSTSTDNQLINSLLETLSKEKLLPLKIQQNLHLAADTLVQEGDTFYLIKPLVTRLWLQSCAYRDAELIIQSLLSNKKNKSIS